MSGTYQVGAGVLAAMQQDGTTPASDEVYIHGRRAEAQWSETMGANGFIYRWLPATGIIYRYDGADDSVAAKLKKVVQAARREIGKPYTGPIVGMAESTRYGDPGYDCSSFVYSMYKKNLGISLVPFTDAIADMTDRIGDDQDHDRALEGDIILFIYDDSQNCKYPHTGLWLSSERMIDCSFTLGVKERPMLRKVFNQDVKYVIHRARGI
jgi:hypothetical protein